MDLIIKVKNLIEKTRFQVLNKQQINLYFPYLNNFVDLILVTEHNYICIKDFWTFNNLNQDILNNYIGGSEQVNTNSNEKFIFILFNKNNKIINNEYKNNLINKNIFILQKNSCDKLLSEFSYLLYSNQIYFYESDLDSIMLE